MRSITLLCARCGANLAPTISGLRCPRLTACGRGGIIETLSFQPASQLPGADGRADA